MESRESITIEIDAALGLDRETRQVLAESIDFGRNVRVFSTSLYPAMLAAEPLAPQEEPDRILIRAARGEEVMAFYEAALEGPRVLERMIEWQEGAESDIIFEPVAVLWTGRGSALGGSGLCEPVFCHGGGRRGVGVS